MKTLKELIVIAMAATLTVTLVNCGGDDDDGDAAPTAESVLSRYGERVFPGSSHHH